MLDCAATCSVFPAASSLTDLHGACDPAELPVVKAGYVSRACDA
jgi:hypothetical protein